jgi:hypothetical protein
LSYIVSQFVCIQAIAFANSSSGSTATGSSVSIISSIFPVSIVPVISDISQVLIIKPVIYIILFSSSIIICGNSASPVFISQLKLAQLWIFQVYIVVQVDTTFQVNIIQVDMFHVHTLHVVSANVVLLNHNISQNTNIMINHNFFFSIFCFF